MLGRGKALQAADRFGTQNDVLAMGGVPFEGLLDRLPELLVAAGFLQEIQAPAFIARTTMGTSP